MKHFFAVLFLLSPLLNIASEKDTLPASFPGGNDAIFSYLERTIHCDKFTQELAGNASHMAVAVFTVSSLGKVHSVSIINSTLQSLDNQFAEAINNMPDWKPALTNTKEIDSRVYLPIRFGISGRQIIIVNNGKELSKGRSKKGKWLKVGIVSGAVVLLAVLLGTH